MASLLLTRPQPQSERFSRLVGMVAPTVISPLLRIEHLEPRLPDDVAGVIVTSANGASALPRLGVDPRLPVFAVGRGTAEVVRGSGHSTMSADGDAEALMRMILDQRPLGPLLHVRGEVARGDIAARLSAAGVPCREIVAYRQVPEPLTAEARQRLDGREPVVAPLFSPRTGSMFASNGPFSAPLRLICISDAVADAVAGLAAESRTIAPRPEAVAMADLTRVALGA